jgi:CelD/BcsL family acetyltransferase involved in cellulose biosynthesis
MNKNKYDISSFSQLDPALIKAWSEIEKVSESYFFQNFNFIKNYLDFHNKSTIKNLKFIVVRLSENKKVICIFPFQIIKMYRVKILQWLGSNDFDYCCPVINKNINLDDHFVDIWQNVLKTMNGYDLILFDKQPKKIGTVMNPFVKYLPCIPVSKIYLINLNTNFENYINSIKNKKFISEFNRTEKKLKLDNKVELKIIDPIDQTLFPSDIIKQKINLLNKVNKKHNFNKQILSFFDFFRAEYPQKTILAALFVNNKIIAACFNLIHKERFYYLIPATFSNEYNKYSPGKILISFLIKWSSINKIKIFDFGLGEESYKKYWSNNTTELFRYIYFKTTKGLIIYVLIKIFLFCKFLKKLI